ncbi:MAG: hypothetical protein IMX06_00585 [Kyrpidia tusciae]|nr:hypothetical protein [Kyrpidia tusciae]MBE3551363.1 hypothetical protein [Kyrpidia tusciae]
MAAVKPLKQVVTKPSAKPRPGERRLPRLSPEVVRDRVSLVAVVLLAVAVVSWVISRDAAITARNYHVQEVQGQVADLEQQNNVLQSEVSRLSAPSRVVDVAKKMGLVPVSPDQWRVLSASGGGGSR